MKNSFRKRNAVFKTLTIMLLYVFVLAYSMVCTAELQIEPGSKDKDADYIVGVLGDYEYANGYVLNGGISTKKAEDLLNKGYCLQYLDSWKSAGKIPSDFIPASQKSQTSSSNTTTQNNTTETPTTNNTKSDTTKQETKKYSDEEIANAWKLVTTVDATCATDGFKEYKNTLTNEKKTETIPATGEHDYQVTDSTDATCTEKGRVTYTCSVCGDTYTEESDFADHDYKEVETKDATCTEDGYTKYECTVCGDSYEDVIKATGHDDGEWTVTKEASFFEKGEKELKCTVCGEVLDTEEIASTCPIPLAGVVIIAIVACGVIAVVIYMVHKKYKMK